MGNLQVTVCKILFKRGLEIFTSVGNPGNFYKCRKFSKFLQVSEILEILKVCKMKMCAIKGKYFLLTAETFCT